MLTRMTERDYCSPLLTGSIATMIFTFFFAIIGGPNYCHYINLFALVLTLIALVILKRNFFSYSFFKKLLLTLLLIVNLTLGIFLMYIKYGYLNRQYLNPFQIEQTGTCWKQSDKGMHTYNNKKASCSCILHFKISLNIRTFNITVRRARTLACHPLAVMLRDILKVKKH